MREQTRTKQPTSWMQVDFGLNPGTANHIVMLGFMTVSSFSVAGNSRLFKYVHCKSKCSPKQCLHNVTPVPLLRVQKHTDTESRKCRDQERADQNWNSRTLTHQCTLSLSFSLSLSNTHSVFFLKHKILPTMKCTKWVTFIISSFSVQFCTLNTYLTHFRWLLDFFRLREASLGSGYRNSMVQPVRSKILQPSTLFCYHINVCKVQGHVHASVSNCAHFLIEIMSKMSCRRRLMTADVLWELALDSDKKPDDTDESAAFLAQQIRFWIKRCQRWNHRSNK